MFRRAWAFAAVVAFAGPLFAADPPANSDQKMPPFTAPELKTVVDRLDKIDQAIKRMDEQQTKLLEVTAAALQKDINELRDQISSVRREIDDLRGRMNREATTSRKPTDAGTANVLLVNDYPTMEMDAVINGATHRVLPGMTLAVPVPAGPVNIQVIQTDAMVRTRMLVAGETKIVTMR